MGQMYAPTVRGEGLLGVFVWASMALHVASAAVWPNVFLPARLPAQQEVEILLEPAQPAPARAEPAPPPPDRRQQAERTREQPRPVLRRNRASARTFRPAPTPPREAGELTPRRPTRLAQGQAATAADRAAVAQERAALLGDEAPALPPSASGGPRRENRRLPWSAEPVTAAEPPGRAPLTQEDPGIQDLARAPQPALPAPRPGAGLDRDLGPTGLAPLGPESPPDVGPAAAGPLSLTRSRARAAVEPSPVPGAPTRQPVVLESPEAHRVARTGAQPPGMPRLIPGLDETGRPSPLVDPERANEQPELPLRRGEASLRLALPGREARALAASGTRETASSRPSRVETELPSASVGNPGRAAASPGRSPAAGPPALVGAEARPLAGVTGLEEFPELRLSPPGPGRAAVPSRTTAVAIGPAGPMATIPSRRVVPDLPQFLPGNSRSSPPGGSRSSPGSRISLSGSGNPLGSLRADTPGPDLPGLGPSARTRSPRGGAVGDRTPVTGLELLERTTLPTLRGAETPSLTYNRSRSSTATGAGTRLRIRRADLPGAPGSPLGGPFSSGAPDLPSAARLGAGPRMARSGSQGFSGPDLTDGGPEPSRPGRAVETPGLGPRPGTGLGEGNRLGRTAGPRRPGLGTASSGNPLTGVGAQDTPGLEGGVGRTPGPSLRVPGRETAGPSGIGLGRDSSAESPSVRARSSAVDVPRLPRPNPGAAAGNVRISLGTGAGLEGTGLRTGRSAGVVAGGVRGIPFRDLLRLESPGGSTAPGPLPNRTRTTPPTGRGLDRPGAAPGTPGGLHVVYVLDVSKSMEFRNKLQQAQRALKTALAELDPGDSFNVVLFSNEAIRLSPQMLPVTPENVRRAGTFVDGASTNPATNFSAAVAAAFALSPITHVFLLSDGEPSAGIVDFDRLRAEVRRLNTTRAQIVTLALSLGERFPGIRLLQGIAEDSGGQFTTINLR